MIKKYNNSIFPYPNDCDFIFSIFDDTDVSTLDNIRPVYDFLYKHGILTTKAVWPLDYDQDNSHFAGSHTLENHAYAKYIKELSKRGFEIAFHGASMESSNKEKTKRALENFFDILGFFPRSYASHASNRENLYWGTHRFSSKLLRIFYHTLGKDKNSYFGTDKSSEYFWGDLAKKHIAYTRSFTFYDINLLNITKYICYRSPHFPCVNNWFITSDADNVEEFNQLISAKNQDKLENERGICIISTHFGKGFVSNGQLNPVTKELLLKLSRRKGLFVPVSTLLDFISEKTCLDNEIPNSALIKIEFHWLIRSISRRLYKKSYSMTEKEYLSKNQ